MGQITDLLGHLDWMLAQPNDSVRPNALRFYNCAIRLHLETLDGTAFASPQPEKVQRKLRKLIDELANAALRLYIDERDAKTKKPRLTNALVEKGRSVVSFARSKGFSIVSHEEQSAYLPPDLSAVLAALSHQGADTDSAGQMPKSYAQEISDGLLDALIGASYSRSPARNAKKVGRTMLNTGAAIIRQAGQSHTAARIPALVTQHNKLAARALRTRP